MLEMSKSGALQTGRNCMEYLVITFTPEILNINPVVHGPFETLDEAEDVLERWINLHPGTRGIIRRLICPLKATSELMCVTSAGKIGNCTWGSRIVARFRPKEHSSLPLLPAQNRPFPCTKGQ